ncbi:MAG: hypothetical protein KC457_20545, partial [Myxococcales bacterium]|nr:hypothetical protein [Myxococcales bacterium]
MATAPALSPAPGLPYRHVFSVDELDDALACYHDHGFAVIKSMAPPETIAVLRQAVDDLLGADDIRPGENRTSPEFVEKAPGALRLLEVPAYIELNRRLFATDRLTIHRSFAVLKNAGSAPVKWHRDLHRRGVGANPSKPDEYL